MKYLEETFELLRKHMMKLNPEKCTFEVTSGNFLGFMVSHKGDNKKNKSCYRNEVSSYP